MLNPWLRVRRAIWQLRNGRRFGSPVDMNLDPRYRKYEIGAYSYGAPAISDWNEGTTLRVGKYCSFAEGVEILLGGQHRSDWVTTYPFSHMFGRAREFPGHPRTKGDVVIGNDVWIATGAMILSGVRIGDGAVVAARSLVTRDVPPYAIVTGAPATVNRFRFGEAEVAALRTIAWWNWPPKDVEAAWPFLMSDDIAAFIERYAERAR